jgi:hypothetical protein
MKREKQFLRKLKRQIKRAGNRKRRRYLKDVTAAAEGFDLGRDRTDVMNERRRVKERRWQRTEEMCQESGNESQ